MSMMDFVKPFYRFQMANGGYGIFLPYHLDNSKLCSYYFLASDDDCTHASSIESQEGTTKEWRPVKIWSTDNFYGIVEKGFDYSQEPVWEEKSPAKRKLENKISELEATIQQAQSQIEALKKEME